MATKQPQNINQTITLIAILLFVIGGFGSYRYALPRLKDARTAQENSRSINEGLKKDIESLKANQKTLADAKAKLKSSYNFDTASLRYIFPPTEDIPALFIQMESLMATTGISDTNYQVGAPSVDTDGLVRVPLTMNVSGSYIALKNYLSLLQTNIRPISITTASFAPAIDKTTNKPNGLISMSASGFVRATALSSAYTSTKSANASK